MSNVIAIAQKELRGYFASPIAYIVIGFFALLFGLFYYSILDWFVRQGMQMGMMGPQSMNVNQQMIRPLFLNLSVVILFILPFLTARSFAEEKRSGTIELLLTYPVRDGEVLLGKFLAAGAVYLLLLVLTLTYPGLMAAFGRIEWGAILTGYLGLLLLGAAFLAVGVFISSLTENQIVAGSATFGVLLAFWLIGWGADAAGGRLRTLLQYLSIIEHMDGFGKGVVDTKDVVYYLTLTAFALFLTLRALDAKRWKG